jgi:hypothetical protein
MLPVATLARSKSGRLKNIRATQSAPSAASAMADSPTGVAASQ